MAKVPVQKGKIESNPMTKGQMNQSERVRDRAAELALMKKGQTLDLYQGKQ